VISKRTRIATLLLCTVVVAAVLPFGVATAYLSDSGSHPPPSTGGFAYYATFGTFGPDQAGFPAVGGAFTDPIFGSAVRRLTNELPQSSSSEIYAKNGFINADGSVMYHRAPGGKRFISTSSGQVIRTGVPGNYDSSFAPDDPDVWYWFNWNGTALNRYRISTGASTVVKNFSDALGELGGSVDWIDGSGTYMVLRLGNAIRVYDVKADVLYSGSIPASYMASGGWIAISPDGRYVVTTGGSQQKHSFLIDHGSRNVSTSPVTFWTLCGSHGDLVSASNGRTYFVTFDCHTTGGVYAADVSLPQSASNVAKQLSDNRKLVQLASWSDADGHFSGVARGSLRDWAFMSVNSGDDATNGSISGWRPYKAEILMMNVLTGEVRRLAHHRSRSLDASYYHQPRVSASFDGSVITWASNFGYSGNGYVDIYAIHVGTTASGGGSGSGDSGGGSSSGGALSAAQLAVIAYARNGNGSYFGDQVSAAVAYQRVTGAAPSGGGGSSSSGSGGALSAAQLAVIAYASNGNGSYFADQVSAAVAYQRVTGAAPSGGGGSSSGGSGGALSAAQLAQIAYARNGNGSYFGDQVSAAVAYQRVTGAAPSGGGGSSSGSSGGALSAAQLAQIAYARNGNGSYFADQVSASVAWARVSGQ